VGAAVALEAATAAAEAPAPADKEADRATAAPHLVAEIALPLAELSAVHAAARVAATNGTRSPQKSKDTSLPFVALTAPPEAVVTGNEGMGDMSFMTASHIIDCVVSTQRKMIG
jgi:hypothetical protein